eukprot:gb/GFBE01024160.1/.p1 GENE.gb/GFBE01024160.1/~~gb/GFBE01024160.1/.p1  ORF type:complete len:324 (+),score=71.44 gb/GFBE01024160.1/:1-972(+)
MPIYEEKLICPLAVRFTQDHIRPQFRDGRELEESFNQIEAKPGKGGYDFILEAPFPAIEIIRWCQSDTDAEDADVQHWFTLDNRRLYCLQRKAASMWPKKCAARVEVLYATSYNSIKRKDTSLSVGRDVSIKCSDHNEHWDWRAVVNRGLETRLRRVLQGISEKDMAEAEELVSSDDGKASIEKLEDAPEAPSMLSHHLQDSSDQLSALVKQADGASTATGLSDAGSTGGSSPRSVENVEDESVPCDDASAWYAALHKTLKGTWTGSKGETYDVTEAKEWATWKCVRQDAQGSRKMFTIWYDAQSDTQPHSTPPHSTRYQHQG